MAAGAPDVADFLMAAPAVAGSRDLYFSTTAGYQPWEDEVKRTVAGVVPLKFPTHPDVFQANQAMNAKAVPNLQQIWKDEIANGPDSTDYDVPIDPLQQATPLKFELAFARVDKDERFANYTDGHDSNRSTLSVFTCFNGMPRSILNSNSIVCMGVVDTEVSQGDPRDQNRFDISVTTHGVRTIVNTGPQHIYPGQTLVWLPPATIRAPNGQRMPIYQYTKVCPEKLYPTVLPLDFDQSEFSFCMTWLKQCTGGTSVLPTFAEHQSYSAMTAFAKELSSEAVAKVVATIAKGEVGADVGKKMFMALAEKVLGRPPFSATTLNKKAQAAMFYESAGKDPWTALVNFMIYAITRISGTHTQFLLSHIIGKAQEFIPSGGNGRVLIW